MKDPSRLLETTPLRAGRDGEREELERALLRSAFGDVAPDAVRARVLSSVNEVLAELPLRAPGANGAGKRSLLLRLVHAAYLGGGLLAAAAGVGLVMLGQAGTDSDAGASHSSLTWLPGAARSTPAHVAETPATQKERSKPTRLASLSPAEARAARLGQGNALASTHSEHLRSGALANSLGRNARLRDGDEPEDWLGAQLRLLREARVQLQAGRLEQAERVLNSYGPRFPGGVLGPQVDGLREELSERRTTARAVSARSIPVR